MRGVFVNEVAPWADGLKFADFEYVALRQLFLDVSCDRCGYKETYRITFPDKHIELVGRQLPGEEGKQREKDHSFIPSPGVCFLGDD